MSTNTKAIKRRIKSVKNTKKITKAMEMVAAAKMRKATQAALQTRTYAQLAWNLLVNLSKTQKVQLPLLDVRPVKRLLVVLFTSNRGLCGSFNANLIRKTSAQLADPRNISRQRVENGAIEPSDQIEVDVIGVGKKGITFAKKMGYRLVASFTEISDTPLLTDILPISRVVIESYQKKTYDKVVVAYTDFKSTLVQIAKLRQVLPISEHDLEKMIAEVVMVQSADKQHLIIGAVWGDYLFEPSRLEVLNVILPRLVEMQIYQAALESAASEHSARMMAMRNASDAAEDLISELTLNFNKARQAGITQEIAEIIGGAAALA